MSARTVIRSGPAAIRVISSPAATVSLLEDAEVEAGSAVGDEERGHAGLVEADAHPVAGHPRLGDLEGCRTDPVPVADAHLVVAETVHGEVLAELSVDEVVRGRRNSLPVPIRLELVDVHRPLFPAVSGEVALTVAREVGASDETRTVDRLLPDPGTHGPTPPFDVSRQSDVDRDERARPITSQLAHGHLRLEDAASASQHVDSVAPFRTVVSRRPIEVTMPWFPDFIAAAELARREIRAAGQADPVAQYFAALDAG